MDILVLGIITLSANVRIIANEMENTFDVFLRWFVVMLLLLLLAVDYQIDRDLRLLVAELIF